MSKLVTLHEFIMDRQHDFPYATGELSRLLNDIAIASKVVNKDVRRGGFMKTITQNEFNQFISTGRKVVQFSATWCGPCKMLTKTIEDISLDGVEFAKVDVDESRELALQFGVRSVPLLVVFQDGKEIKQAPGAKPRDAVISFVTED